MAKWRLKGGVSDKLTQIVYKQKPLYSRQVKGVRLGLTGMRLIIGKGDRFNLQSNNIVQIRPVPDSWK